MKPIIAIITPAYIDSEERFDFFKITNLSVQNQNVSSLHLVVDDKSSYQPFQNYIQSYGDKSNVIVIYRNRNGGVSAAINTGLNLILHDSRDNCLSNKSDDMVREMLKEVTHFTILHSDDMLYTEDSLSARLDSFRNDTVMIHSAIGIIKGKDANVVFGPPRVSNPEEKKRCFQEILWNGAHISYPTMIWNIKFFKKFFRALNEELNYGEDKLMALLSYKFAIEDNLHIGYCSKPTIVKRIHPKSITGSNKKRDIPYRIEQDKIIYSEVLCGEEYEKAIAERLRHYQMKFKKKVEN